MKAVILQMIEKNASIFKYKDADQFLTQLKIVKKNWELMETPKQKSSQRPYGSYLLYGNLLSQFLIQDSKNADKRGKTMPWDTVLECPEINSYLLFKRPESISLDELALIMEAVLIVTTPFPFQKLIDPNFDFSFFPSWRMIENNIHEKSGSAYSRAGVTLQVHQNLWPVISADGPFLDWGEVTYAPMHLLKHPLFSQSLGCSVTVEGRNYLFPIACPTYLIDKKMEQRGYQKKLIV